MKHILLALLSCFLLTACSAPSGYRAQKDIYTLAHNGFTVQKYHTSTFTLHGLLRPATNNNKSLHVYIEGDGYSWVRRNQQSKNPTPTVDITRNLASYDNTGAAVLYLARPCQYVKAGDLKMCEPKFWGTHRLALEVIIALNEAISKAKQQSQAESISIVGFSGGGGAAVLVAARRNDVDFLGSVAGLLDHQTWTRKHKITPLHGSLNALDSIDLVRHIPQHHIMGLDDKIISPVVNKNYCDNLINENTCEKISNLSHHDQWYKVWDYNKMP